ncbi:MULTISPECIES: hypothetical protein [Streptomyces]|uniref:Uncharacterized protein n=2 Tax=Streptomyces TaxID=1883 RepID=A0ABV9IEB0_9ACTN
MGTLPGGDVASRSSSAGTAGFLVTGQTGEPMPERLPASGRTTAADTGVALSKLPAAAHDGPENLGATACLEQAVTVE